MNFGFGRIGIARKHQLCDVTNPSYRRIHLLWMDCIAQAQDVGIGCHDGKARPSVAIFNHGAIDQHPFAGCEFQDKPGHAFSPVLRRPRMTEVLMSISASALAVPPRTLRV